MAVTGSRRIEVWLTPKVYDSIGGRDSLGFCAVDADRVKRNLEGNIQREEIKQHYGKRANAEPFRTALAVVQRDLAELRSKGVTGTIPLCAYPASGKRHGTLDDRYERRGTAIHERFHAAVRGTEVEFRLPYMGDCMVGKEKELLTSKYPDDFKQAMAVSKELKWARNPNSHTEEILARVEEIRQSCNRSVEDCDDINRKIASQVLVANSFSRGRLNADACLFQRLAGQITEDFRGALSIPRQAARQCAGVAKPEPRKRNKAKR